MKMLLVLLVLGAGGYYAYMHFQDTTPAVITDPVFGEVRIGAKVAGRELDMVLFAKMQDETDCRTRTQEVWDRTIGACAQCTMNVSACKPELDARYQRMFDNQPTHSTYMAFTSGNKDERDGRMVIFGLTSDEGDAICEMMKTEFAKRYTGDIQCVRGRRD